LGKNRDLSLLLEIMMSLKCWLSVVGCWFKTFFSPFRAGEKKKRWYLNFVCLELLIFSLFPEWEKKKLVGFKNYVLII